MPLLNMWLALPRTLRFLVVGGINTLFGYGCYALLLFVGFHYAWAAFFGTILAVLFNFLTTSRWVFDVSPLSFTRLQRFILVYGFHYLINVTCLWVLDQLGLNPYVSGLILLLPMAGVAYLLIKEFVYKS